MAQLSAGIDIIEVERVRKAIARHPERFLGRIYTELEIAYCRGRIQELAARFAAKEATMKALGTGVRGIAWREIEILADRRGKPLIYLHGKAERRAKALGLGPPEVSITHDAGLAVVFVVATRSVQINYDEELVLLIDRMTARGLL